MIFISYGSQTYGGKLTHCKEQDLEKKKAKKTKNAEVEIQCIKENIPGKSIKENIKNYKITLF